MKTRLCIELYSVYDINDICTNEWLRLKLRSFSISWLEPKIVIHNAKRTRSIPGQYYLNCENAFQFRLAADAEYRVRGVVWKKIKKKQ